MGFGDDLGSELIRRAILCADDCGLAPGLESTLPIRLVPVAVDASDIRLIDLYGAGECVVGILAPSIPDAVEHEPRGFLAGR